MKIQYCIIKECIIYLSWVQKSSVLWGKKYIYVCLYSYMFLYTYRNIYKFCMYVSSLRKGTSVYIYRNIYIYTHTFSEIQCVYFFFCIYTKQLCFHQCLIKVLRADKLERRALYSSEILVTWIYSDINLGTKIRKTSHILEGTKPSFFTCFGKISQLSREKIFVQLSYTRWRG